LLNAYTEKHLATLKKWQQRILVWHSGQISGFLNDYPMAISRMEETINEDEKPTDPFLWNSYVKGSIAFLKKNKSTLLKERAQLSKGSSPFNQINLRVIDFFIRCFESSY